MAQVWWKEVANDRIENESHLVIFNKRGKLNTDEMQNSSVMLRKMTCRDGSGRTWLAVHAHRGLS